MNGLNLNYAFIERPCLLKPILALKDVEKRYGAFQAVDKLNFEVHQREIFGFLGPNGAGKTTTLRMLLDIIQPTSGGVQILGSDNAATVRNKIGYLPEERGLYRKMKAVDTIAYFGRLRGLHAKEAQKRAFELLEEFGLGEFAKSKNEAMSKGMAQKIQLLATLAHEPELLILDEPFSGLDPINQHMLESLIRRLRDEGRTVIFSTHVMEHAERLCDRFLILAKGQKRFEGTLEEARALFPPKLLIRTSDDISPLREAPGIVEITQLQKTENADSSKSAQIECNYECILARNADIQEILRFAFNQNLALTQFEHDRGSLHDIFVSLAGDQPMDGTQQNSSNPKQGSAVA